jgi:RNA-directed DNA polymerase
MHSFIKGYRHMKLCALIDAIKVKLRGHFQYYGITFNFRGIKLFYEHVRRILYNWLRRKGGKSKWIRDSFILLIEQWRPLVKPFISNSYALS